MYVSSMYNGSYNRETSLGNSYFLEGVFVLEEALGVLGGDEEGHCSLCSASN